MRLETKKKVGIYPFTKKNKIKIKIKNGILPAYTDKGEQAIRQGDFKIAEAFGSTKLTSIGNNHVKQSQFNF